MTLMDRWAGLWSPRTTRWGVAVGGAFCAVYGPLSVWGLPDISPGAMAMLVGTLGASAGGGISAVFKAKVDQREKERWVAEGERLREEAEQKRKHEEEAKMLASRQEAVVKHDKLTETNIPDSYWVLEPGANFTTRAAQNEAYVKQICERDDYEAYISDIYGRIYP